MSFRPRNDRATCRQDPYFHYLDALTMRRRGNFANDFSARFWRNHRRDSFDLTPPGEVGLQQLGIRRYPSENRKGEAN